MLPRDELVSDTAVADPLNGTDTKAPAPAPLAPQSWRGRRGARQPCRKRERGAGGLELAGQQLQRGWI